jgi:predicted transcriptional regulator
MTSDNVVLCELLFEASNEDRLQIVSLLSEKPMNLTTLSKRTGIGTQEISRHVARLTESGIIKRETDGLNNITPYGMLALSQLSGLRFITKNRHYFSEHYLDKLPESFIHRLGELNESTYLEDTILAFDNVERMIQESEEYVYRITDRYLTSWLPVIEDALQRGIEYRLLSPEDVVVPSNFKMGLIMTKARISEQFKVGSIPGPYVFLAMSEKEVSALGFPNTKGKMDYYSFSSKDLKFHGWCYDLFNYYWSRSTAKPRETILRWGTFEKEEIGK